jgi:mRNA-degrading endonuclease RelE of RelBE toxin-antitoxin system
VVSYEVIVDLKARKAIARLPSAVYGRVVQAIDYRIVYDVDDESQEVYVAEVWPRKRHYR